MRVDSRTHDRFSAQNVKAAAQRAMGKCNLMELDALDEHSGVLDAGTSNVVVRGDISSGAAIRGEGLLLVNGSVVGSSERPCKIDMAEGVYIVGSFRQTEVSSRRIQIGKWASKSVLSFQESLEIGGDVVDVKMVCEPQRADNRKSNAERRKLSVARKESELLDQQVAYDQRRTDRLFQATGIKFDVSVGDVVTRESNRTQVNLEPFYKVVGKKTPKEIDRALLEFFAKAVVGLLTRVNKQYIMGGTNNRKTFTTVIRKLHDLTFLTRKCDKLKEQIRLLENTISGSETGEGIDAARAFIGGSILPEFKLQFQFINEYDSKDNCSAKLSLTEGGSPPGRKITLVDSRGEDKIESVSAEAFSGVEFFPENGAVAWCCENAQG